MAADDNETRDQGDHYAEAADGLEAAAKALRACGDEEASEDNEETPVEKQPKDLKGAAKAARSRFAQARKEARSNDESGKPDKGDKADDGNKPLP